MWKLLLLLLSFLTILAQCQLSNVDHHEKEEEAIRVKRSYYGGYDMYGDDFWYAGRIIGIIIGICLLLCCCCLPCVCIAGIWFAGWFGLRNRKQKGTQQVPPTSTIQPPPSSSQAPGPIYPMNYDTQPGNANYIPVQSTVIRQPRHQPHQIHVDSSPRDSETSGQVIYTAEDRYYTSSSAPAPHRPETTHYNVSSSRY